MGYYPVTRLGEYVNWVRTSYIDIDPVTVAIPASVTNIGNNAFANCLGLAQITVDKGNQYYSSQDGVLFNKSVDKLLCFPSGKAGAYTIPSTVTSIEYQTFAGVKA